MEGIDQFTIDRYHRIDRFVGMAVTRLCPKCESKPGYWGMLALHGATKLSYEKIGQLVRSNTEDHVICKHCHCTFHIKDWEEIPLCEDLKKGTKDNTEESVESEIPPIEKGVCPQGEDGTTKTESETPQYEGAIMTATDTNWFTGAMKTAGDRIFHGGKARASNQAASVLVRAMKKVILPKGKEPEFFKTPLGELLVNGGMSFVALMVSKAGMLPKSEAIESVASLSLETTGSDALRILSEALIPVWSEISEQVSQIMGEGDTDADDNKTSGKKDNED